MGECFTTEDKTLALMKGLVEAKDLGLSNLLVEGNAITIISQVTKKKSGSWRFDGWLCQVFNTTT